MSSVGDLIKRLAPDGVRYLSIGEFAEVSSGATPASGHPEFWDGGTIPWMSSGEVNLGTLHNTEKKITQVGYDSCSTKMLPPNVVVMALAGQGKTRGLVARTRIALCTNQSLAGIIPNESVATDFLFYFLQTQYQQLRSISSGDGARGGLNLQMIRAFRVPVPPLAVQAEIVRILDQFTELKAELEVELEVRRRQYAYYRDELLTFEPQEVPWITLGEVCGIFDGTHQTPRYLDAGVPFVSVENIKNPTGTKKFISDEDFARNYRIKPAFGDVLMTRIGTIGSCAMVMNDSPLAYYVTLALLRPDRDRLRSSYLRQVIESRIGASELRKRTLTTAVPIKINLGEIGNIRIPIPPLAQQDRIADILEAFEVLTGSLSVGLPAEISARHKQYEYYRDQLLTFREAVA